MLMRCQACLAVVVVEAGGVTVEETTEKVTFRTTVRTPPCPFCAGTLLLPAGLPAGVPIHDVEDADGPEDD